MKTGQGAARQTITNRVSRGTIERPRRGIYSKHLLAVIIAAAYSACMPLEDGLISTSLHQPDQLIGNNSPPAVITDNYMMADPDPAGHRAAVIQPPYKPAINHAQPDGAIGLYAAFTPRAWARSGMFNPDGAPMLLREEEGLDPALGHYWHASIIPFRDSDDIDRTAVLTPVRIAALCGCYDVAIATRFNGTDFLILDFAAGTGRLADISLAAADEPPVVGNLEFSLRLATTGFTDHAASVWLQLDGTTESQWEATIAGILHDPDAPHINAQFTALSSNLQRRIIGKFSNKD